MKRTLPVKAIVCLYLLLCLRGAQAQDIPGRIDSLFTASFLNNEFYGNVLVTEKGKVVYERAFGYANVEDSMPNRAGTRFHVASVAKVLTATAILQLREKGKLQLDDPVQRYLPDFPLPAVTIRHLLSHTSGLPDFQIFEAPHRQDTGKIFSNADLIPAIRAYQQPLPPPGEKWSYSNTGYGLLALIVEKTAGMPFQAYLEKRIFKPAGMQHTYLQTSLIPVPDPQRAVPYDFPGYAPTRLKRVDSLRKYRISSVILGGIIGQGNIVSTTGDLQRFDQALYNGRLLQPASLAEAFTPARLNNGEKAAMGWGNGQSYYGLGWMILRDTSMGKIVWHSGGAAGMVTVFLRNISKGQTVIVLDNVTHRNVHGDGINALYLLNGQPAATGKRSLAGIYIQALFSQGPDFAATRLNTLKTDTAHYYMNEQELNIRGLELLWDGYTTLALEALKLNTFLYPASWNVYDSYASVLKAAGKKQEAIAMYQQSIALNPSNKGGQAALQQLMAGH